MQHLIAILEQTRGYAKASYGIGLDMLDASCKGAYGDALGDSFASIEWVEGSAFADKILATADANRLSGGAGNDWLDGRGGNDVFDFTSSSGRDVIADIAAGPGLGDVIQFHGQFTSFAQVLTAAHEVSNVTSPLGAAFTGTVITSGADEIWLANIKLAQLAANDFGF